ncbi:MAG TPA: hypothetical protein VIJ52_00735 [Pseudolabrys sp.]
MKTMQGTVIFYSTYGYGFIKPSDEGVQVYFTAADFPSPPAKPGQHVNFRRVSNRKLENRIEARDISIVGPRL